MAIHNGVKSRPATPDRLDRTGPPPCARTAATFAAIAMAGVPLLIARGVTLNYETTPRLVLLLISTAAILLCFKAWWPGVLTLIETRRGKLFVGVLAAQALSLIASTVFSSQPMLSLAGSSWRRYGLVTQLTILTFSLLIAAIIAAHAESLRKILLAIAASSGLIAIYAIAQSSGFDPFLLRSSYSITYWNGELVRGPGTLGHAVYLGGFLAAAIPIIAGLASEAKSIRRLTLWGILTLSLVATILSGSRSALLALGVATLFSLPVLGRISLRNRWIGAAICVAGAAALLFFVSLHSGSNLGLHVERWRQDLYGGTRLLLWRDSLRLMAAHPIAGSGSETFGNQFRQLQSAELSRAYPDYYQESPHNFLLEGAIAQGCFFFVVIAGIGYLLLYKWGTANQGPATWICASIAATLVSLLFLPVTISGGLMLYGMLGLLASVRAPISQPRRVTVPTFMKLTACSLAVVLVAAAFAYLRQDMSYARMGAAVKEHRFAEITPAYRAATSIWFPAAGEDLWASRQFAGITTQLDPPAAAQAWALAGEAAALAERTGDNRADAAYQSALVAISTNHAKQAEMKLRKAIEYAPTTYKPHLLMAQLLFFTGRKAESSTQANAALDYAGSQRPRVVQALRELGIDAVR
jgi:O-antigen ligase